MREPKCPSCGKPLEEGFLLDQGHGASYPVSWVAGAPERSFWGGVKHGRRRRLAVYAMRCTSCGLLHFVAPGEPPVA